MRRSVILFAGVALVAAASGAITASVMDRYLKPSSDGAQTTIVEKSTPASTIFTSAATEGNYPDLTYAAESAVKAVVSIESTKRVASSQYIDAF
jgi:hypothetical protein